MVRSFYCWLGIIFVTSFLSNALAADPAAAPSVPVFHRKALPQTHAYQKTLREFIGTLKPSDFDHGVTTKFTKPPVAADAEQQYRHHILSLMAQPLVGTKRGAPAVNAPGKLFTLAEIETEAGVMRPPVWTEPLAFLVRWDYPGNPYFQSRALKLRTFVTMCIHLMMIDELHEHAPETGGASRTDWLSSSLIVVANPYNTVRDVLPEPVRQAYLTGLRKLGDRALAWGRKGEEPNLDVGSTVALWYVAQALNDPTFSAAVETYSRRMFTEEQTFHPAGYFVDRGGIDLGFAGQTNFFASWLALATRWPFATDVVDRCYRLRAHLSLPEPDGKTVGPSHFQTRYSAEAWRDQWEWGVYRDTAVSLVTDEAAYLTRPVTAEILDTAVARQAGVFQSQLNENSANVAAKRMLLNDEIGSTPWQFRLWQSYNFPAMVNFAFDYYPSGARAHRQQLEKENSPLLKSPFLRDETFVRDFSKAFTVAKFPSYSAIVHSGPVGGQTLDDSLAVLPGPYGFGGGQLSAFWTPATGAVLLGRRGGVTWDKTFDLLEDWRRWPIHAVSGARLDGKVFTTARIQRPDVSSTVTEKQAVVRVSGVLPKGMLGQNKVLEGRFDYSRTFTLTAEFLKVETTLASTAQDTLAELYETLPVFLRDATQLKAEPSIELLVDKTWQPADVKWTERVTAIRLRRFGGAVRIDLDRPRRVKLSESEWTDTYLSRAACRNLLIDLLENADQPKVLQQTAISYRIQPESQ